MINYYELLKIPPTAPEEEIKKAINRELRIWSNRTNAPQIERRQEADRIVKHLEEAESTLLNASKRAEYDRQFKSLPKEERRIEDSTLTGKDDTDLIKEAWRLLAIGNVADAMYVATKATQAQGNNPEAWAILGQAKYQWGETEDSIYEYKRAIQLKPNEASYYFDLGNIYESAERWDDALQQYQRASQIDPRTTMYRAAIGGLYVRHNMYKEGVEILERCVQEELDNKSYQWLLALAYHDGMLSSWWRNPEDGMYYCTSREQADTAKKIIEKAKLLKFDDQELRATITKTEQLVDSMYERTFKGSWIMVIIWGLFYIIPGALWWFVNRRPNYLLNKDIHDIIELGKRDAMVGGELGAYYSALPPGFKWAATLPRFVVWFLIVLLSPITFVYAAYENYEDNRQALFGVVAGIVALIFAVVIIQGIISKRQPSVAQTNSSSVQYEQKLNTKKIQPRSISQEHDTSNQQNSISAQSSSTSFYTAISGNYNTEQEAFKRAEKLKSMGFEADVLFSSKWSNLRPGYWVAYSGRFTNEKDAKKRVSELTLIGQDAYVRFTGSQVMFPQPSSTQSDDLNKYLESVTSTFLTRDNRYNVDYMPDNLRDNVETTAWSTDLRQNHNPSIIFKFKQPVTITGVTALPGYKKFFIIDRYLQNHKPKRVLFTYDEPGVTDTITFKLVNSYDTLSWQTFSLSKPIVTQSVTLKILDTYSGIRQGTHNQAYDVCISELHFLGKSTMQ